MRKSRFSDEPVVGILKCVELGRRKKRAFFETPGARAADGRFCDTRTFLGCHPSWSDPVYSGALQAEDHAIGAIECGGQNGHAAGAFVFGAGAFRR